MHWTSCVLATVCCCCTMCTYCQTKRLQKLLTIFWGHKNVVRCIHCVCVRANLTNSCAHASHSVRREKNMQFVCIVNTNSHCFLFVTVAVVVVISFSEMLSYQSDCGTNVLSACSFCKTETKSKKKKNNNSRLTYKLTLCIISDII